MDLPPWVNSAADPPADPDDETRRRLAAIENGLSALGDRLDTLATSLENSVRVAVAKDVEIVAADLRHTVSDLGRLLVRDLGRLSKILSEHRDTIVAEVRGQPVSPKPAPKTPAAVPGEASVSPVSPLVDIRPPDVASIPVADGSDASDTGEESGMQGGSWRGNRRRRRDS